MRTEHCRQAIARSPILGGAVALAAVLCLLPAGDRVALGQARGTFYLDVVDQETDQPLAFRAQVRNARDQLVRLRGVTVVDNWSLVDGPLNYRGMPGDFTYRIFRGPEYSTASGGFTVDKNAESSDYVKLERHADLASEFWYGGDLASRIPAAEARGWLAAEGLHMAVSLLEQEVTPEQTAALEGWTEQGSYEDRRSDGGLVIHHWQPPAEVPAEMPSARLLVAARGASVQDPPPRSDNAATPRVHCEITRPWARELPIWLASQRIDSIQVLGEHLTFDGQRGLPVRLPVSFQRRFPERLAAGMNVEQVYWQVLEAGLRIPPSAGSGFGKRGSPLGYNRVYAFCQPFTVEGWWEALRSGQSFITNGPLLRVTVNEQVPGHLFIRPAGEVLELDVAVQLTVADPVQYLDVIYNGEKLYEARLDEFAREGGRIPGLKVSASGWLVVRVVTERDHTYRMASTAPYYFEFGGQPRISRSAVEYFRKWLSLAREEAQGEGGSAGDRSAGDTAQQDPGDTPPKADAWRAAAVFYDAAAKFWDARLAEANCD